MHTFQGLAVDAGVSVDGDCAVTHVVSREGIEIDFESSFGALHLFMTEGAAIKLINVLAVAMEDFQQSHALAAGGER